MENTTTTTVTLVSHAAFVVRLRKGQVTAEELRAHLDALIASEAALKAEIAGLTVKAIKTKFPRFYHAPKKDGLVREAFNSILESVVHIKSFSYSLFSGKPYSEILREAAAKLTDEDIAAHAQAYAESVARARARLEAVAAEAGIVLSN